MSFSYEWKEGMGFALQHGLLPRCEMMRALVLAAMTMVVAFGQDDPDTKGPSEKDPAKVFQPLTPEQEKILQAKKQKFVIAEVTSEPAMPSEDEAKKQGFDELPGGGYLHKTRDDKKDILRVVLPGTVRINSGFIEVFSTLGPKDHETVLRTYCDVHVLDVILSSEMRIERGNYPEKYGETDAHDGSRILVFVQWRDDKGVAHTYRAEDLVIDWKHEGTFPRVGWVYLGQWHESEHPVTKSVTHTLRAALSKLLITTFRDPYSLMDNALKAEDATGNMFAANEFLLPALGTSIQMILRKPTADEMNAIKQVEKNFYK